MNIQIHRLSYSYPVKIQYNIISMHIKLCIFFYSGTSQTFFLGNLNKRAKVVILHIKGLANQVCTIILATTSSDSVACVERAGSRISEKWEKKTYITMYVIEMSQVVRARAAREKSPGRRHF